MPPTAYRARPVLDGSGKRLRLRLVVDSSSVEFVLRFWINDPVDGVANVRGAVLLALWDILKREKIEFPSGMGAMRIARPVQVVIERGGEAVDLPRA